tara:strand:- start:42 stop:254 length:213 start_codon:yes stop_codon:yes gene_type:complete
MKTQEEIENLASEKILSEQGQVGFTLGYNECQQDMADKKYTEEDIINIVNKSRETRLTAEYLILQLNKQD